MPEGHTIHRLARRLRRDLGGRVVVSSSPQGRFSAGAAEVDGTELTGVDAAGKHLFLRFGDRTVHVHLGLFGRFRRVTGSEAAPPTENTRWVLGSDAIEWRLSGPMACELADPGTEDDIRSRLGPDPLAGDDGGAFRTDRPRERGAGSDRFHRTAADPGRKKGPRDKGPFKRVDQSRAGHRQSRRACDGPG